MNKIKTNIKKALKEFKKEYKQNVALDAMWENWYQLSWILDKNGISIQFSQIDEGCGSSTIATYWVTPIQKVVVLDWDVSSQYEDLDDLIDTIANLEEEGIKIEQYIKKGLTINKQL